MKKFSELAKNTHIEFRGLKKYAGYYCTPDACEAAFLKSIGLTEQSVCCTLKVDEAREFFSSDELADWLENQVDDMFPTCVTRGETYLDVANVEIESLRDLLNIIVRRQPFARIEDEPVDIPELFSLLKQSQSVQEQRWNANCRYSAGRFVCGVRSGFFVLCFLASL